VGQEVADFFAYPPEKGVRRKSGGPALAVVGATWLLYLLHIISFGVLLYVFATFAKRGLGNRQVIVRSCLMGLMFLAQVAVFPQIGA
jgi:hypothetical protein